MKLKFLEKNKYVDIDSGEIVEGDPRDLNIHVAFFMDTVMHFGKYKGLKISDIREKDPSYIRWMKHEGFSIYVEFEFPSKASKESNIHVYQSTMFRDGKFQNGFDVMASDITSYLNSKVYENHPEIGDPFDEDDLDIYDVM